MNEAALAAYKKVGIRIREIRQQKGMSQAELAEKAYISLPHVSDIELGKTVMKLDTFMRITEALKVSADILLRPDIPEVNNIYQNEFADVLKDCTPNEIDSIIRIVRELISTMHSSKELNNE